MYALTVSILLLLQENVNTESVTVLADPKYERTVLLATKDNSRLINILSCDSDEWKKEFNTKNFC